MNTLKPLYDHIKSGNLTLPKAFLFDMDGVLYNSMPMHAEAWSQVLKLNGVEFSPYEVYLQEGSTSKATIINAFRDKLGKEVSSEDVARISKEKNDFFATLGVAPVMDYAGEVLNLVKELGCKIALVTGSANENLLAKLMIDFPGIFTRETMVTAFDVVKGKPDPEPYLKGLQKLGVDASEAIVVENAPLGVEAAKAAGIYTIAVNTGILKDEALSQADLVF